jgi:large subunit ribosomal protein L18
MIRHRRIRAKVAGTGARPRLAVFRSNRALYVQVIDDVKQVTLASAKGDTAVSVGKAIAEQAKEKGITSVVFDRGGFEYAGAVRALADAAREAGLIF